MIDLVSNVEDIVAASSQNSSLLKSLDDDSDEDNDSDYEQEVLLM